MTIKTESLRVSKQSQALSGTILETILVFLISYIILFIGMSLAPTVYDEGLILTGAMQVLAGQIPHRDFYALYGPGQFYALAGLFKLFGESILVERLFDLFLKAFIGALVYRTVLSYCRRSIAIWAAFVSLLWFFGLDEMAGNPIVPVALLNLIASILILPVFLRPVSAKRMLAAGAVAGMAALVRYDTGIALFAVQTGVFAIAIYLRVNGIRDRLRDFVFTFSPYLIGFAAVTLSALSYYLSRAPIHDFVHDMFLFIHPRYYYLARNLPFPGINLRGLDKLGVYFTAAIICFSLYIAVTDRLRTSKMDASNPSTAKQGRGGFLITFGLLALAMYFKGIVRVSLIHMYLSILPSILLIAVLFQHRMTFTRPIRICITLVGSLFVLTAGLSSLREIRTLHINQAFLPANIWLSTRGTLPEIRATWCKNENPLTRGVCFFPDNDHIQTIEFIRSHTRPDQKLFVGLTRTDIVFANDNIIYFASQRLPATKWSHFDPYLQTTYEIQAKMIQEFEATEPQYVVLDSEYDSTREPNGSSQSTGVTLLDEYIHSKYQKVETFGEFFIWKRIGTP